MTFNVHNCGSKYPYFNRAYVVSSGFGCLYLYLVNNKIQDKNTLKIVIDPLLANLSKTVWDAFIRKKLGPYLLWGCAPKSKV